MSAQTDRELLLAAAAAAGIELTWAYDIVNAGSPTRIWEDGKPGDEWNPLTDDGDALRLAVKLGLQIECRCLSRDFVAVRTGEYNWKEFRESTVSEHVPVATRRAIVRAAASLPAKESGQ